MHVPFCGGKCHYCSFYSVRYAPDLAREYTQALAAEFDRRLGRGRTLSPRTVYVGGGTPSILDDGLFDAVLSLLASRFRRRRLQEWTVEANPGTLTAAKVDSLRRAGVTRVSLGVQSLNDGTLRRAGRRHDAQAVAETVAALRQGGIRNIGLDLIAGLPGVTSREWAATLAGAVEFAPRHVSVYALSVEPQATWDRTPPTRRFPGERAVLASLAEAEGTLARAGCRRYEISNYAHPGFECQHNLAVWRGQDYLGFGPAAASRVGRRRWTNVPDLAAYAAAEGSNDLSRSTTETFTARRDAAERFIFGFRLAEGVNPAAFAGKNRTRLAAWTQTLQRLASDGLVEREGPRWRLTGNGRLFADTVASELLATS